MLQAAELEFVELKGSSFFHEGRKEYRHYNFLVKCSDGTTTLFFAETCPCCKEDSGIYLCCPLEENDNGSIYTNISRFFVKTWQDNYILFRRLLFFFIRHALMPSPFPPFSGKCFGCQKCGVELRHPTFADYFGGHRDICIIFSDIDDEVACYI